MSNSTSTKLAIITGRPGSGKSTLAALLAETLRVPLISRDRLKEGLVRSAGLGQIPEAELAHRVNDVFFATIESLLLAEVSLVAEAAFQHRVWAPRLGALQAIADMRIIICDVAASLARDRLQRKAHEDPQWSAFHPLPDNHLGPDQPYDAPTWDVPMLLVETTSGYQPGLKEILGFLT